jgi:hypothetical protein
MQHKIDFTDRTPGDADPAGGTFGRCPRCGRVGRMLVWPHGRTYVHGLVESADGYVLDGHCFVPRPLPPVNPARTWYRDGGEWVCVESGTRIPAGDAVGLWRASRRLAGGATGTVVFDVIRYW